MTKNILQGAYIPTPTLNDFRIVTQLLSRFGFPRLAPVTWNRSGGRTFVKPALQDGTKVLYTGGFAGDTVAAHLNVYSVPQQFVVEYMPRVAVGGEVKASKVDYVQINSNAVMSETYGQAKIDLDPQSMYVMGYDVDLNLGPIYKIGLKGAPKSLGFAVKFEDLHRIMGTQGKDNYPVGAAVKLAETSEFYKPNEDHNPVGIMGEVVEHLDTSNPYYIRVHWDNGQYNSYGPSDLVNYGTYIGIGDIVKTVDNLPIITSTDKRRYAAHIFGEREVSFTSVSGNEILIKLKGDGGLTFNSRQFKVVKKAADIKVEETVQWYELVKSWPGGPAVGTRSDQDQSAFPEFWKPVQSFGTKAGDYIYLTEEVRANEYLTLEIGTVLRVEEVNTGFIKTFGDFEIPLSSARIAYDAEVLEKSHKQVAGHNVVYLGDGVGIGDQYLYEEEVQALKTLLNQRYKVTVIIDGDPIDFEDYFYLHMFSGLPYNKD